jgi:uncharacterized membrane protein
MLRAGLGSLLRLDRGAAVGDVSRFLWTRGIWLVVLELSVVHVGFFFSLDYGVVFLLVFWALGMGMVALEALVCLPRRAVLALSIGMIPPSARPGRSFPPTTAGASGRRGRSRRPRC